MRKRQMETAAAALCREPRLSVVDQGVSHRKGGSAQKMRLVRKSARLTEPQISLMHQCGRLHGHTGPDAPASSSRDVFELVVESRQQLSCDSIHFRGHASAAEGLVLTCRRGWWISVRHRWHLPVTSDRVGF